MRLRTSASSGEPRSASSRAVGAAPLAYGAASHGPLVTRGDEPVLIDLAAHGAGVGVKIVSVDGVPLESDGPTRLAHGWLQARHDGHLTFTPDIDVTGPIRLLLAGVSEAGTAWGRHLDIVVEGLYEAAHVELRNPVKTIPAHAVIAHHAQMAEIGSAARRLRMVPYRFPASTPRSSW